MLVNLAGVDLEAKAEEFGEDDWQKVIDINLSGAFWLSQAAGQAMIAGGRGGRIIQFSSTRSVAGGRRGFAAYSASKAGVNALVRQLATEWGPHGITVNGVAPGFVPTELVPGRARQSAVRPDDAPAHPLRALRCPGRDGGRGALLRQSRRELRHGAGAVRGRRRNGKLLGGRVEQGEDRIHRARRDGRGNGLRDWPSPATTLAVYNRTRSKADPVAELGARVADSPADAAREADVVMTSLADQNVVETDRVRRRRRGEHAAAGRLHRGHEHGPADLMHGSSESAPWRRGTRRSTPACSARRSTRAPASCA